MAVVVERNPENDCTAAMACGVPFSSVLALVLVASIDVVLDRANVTGDSSLPCSDRVSVTKEVIGDRVNELEEVMTEVVVDDAEVDRDVEVVVACTDNGGDTLANAGADAGIAICDGDGGSGGEGSNAETSGEGAGGGANSPKIGFSWFCPGSGLITVMAGAPEGVEGLGSAAGDTGFGTSPMFEVS